MKRLRFYIVVLILAACKKEISVNIADRPAELVVNAELDPDSLIRINLSLTQNITDNSGKPGVTNASIEVMDQDTLIQEVLSNLGGGNYGSIWMKPKAATRYLFRIVLNGIEYWVDERMPDSLKTNLIDTSRIVFQGKPGFFQFTLKIKDETIRENYYGFRLKRIFEKYQGKDTIKNEEWVNIESADFILTEDPESRFSKKHLIFSDRYFNGIEQEFKFGAASLFNQSDQKTLKLQLIVSSYSFGGYRYYTSVNEHLLYQNDPFSQPTGLKGNVVGAFGSIVGSFNTVYNIQMP